MARNLIELSMLHKYLFLLFLIFFPVYALCSDPENQTFYIPSDCGSEIREVVVHYPDGLEHVLDTVYRDLIDVLDKEIKINIVFTSERGREHFSKIIKEYELDKEHDINLAMHESRLITPWARDRYTFLNCVENREIIKILVPSLRPFSDEKHINELDIPVSVFSKRSNFIISKTLYLFTGGNIIADDSNVVINGKMLKSMLNEPFPAMKEKYRTLFGKNIICIDTVNKDLPSPHIDMFITLLDNKRALVADTLLALQLLIETRESYYSLLQRGIDIELHFDDNIVRSLDDIKKQLQDAGYEIIPVPLAFIRGNIIAAYNNVVIDTRHKQATVYIPSFDIPALDQYAVDIYRELGFKVKQLNLKKLYKYLGGIHCLMNVIRKK